MEFGRVCDIGKRDNNEDGILTLEMYADIGFFAVADGLGGHSYGELASKCVLDKAERNLIVGGEFDCSEDNMKHLLESSQESLVNLIESNALYKRMRTTMTALLINNGEAVWGHIGDSRLYFFRDNNILEITADHSVAYMSYMSGEISYNDIRKSDEQSRLIRTMGAAEKFKPDIHKKVDIKPGDAFLLCTDGFWENIDEKQMTDSLKKSKTASRWIAKMVRIVKENTKSCDDCDNFSAITVFV